MSTRERLELVDKSLQARLKRVRKRFLPIMQTGLASGLAYYLAHDVAGHPRPFFAPISVVLIVGMTGGDRVSKSVDMALGCILGVLVGDLIFYRLGAGGWQIAVIVAGSLLIASFFSSSVLINNQAAIGAILIATIMPPGAEVTGIDRTVDAFIGCVVALATIALIPQAPMASARAEVSKVMGIMSSVLDDVAKGLRHGDAETIAARLYDTESANLARYGYGIKGFMLSMVQTAIELTDGRIDGRAIGRILELGQEMLAHPVDLLPGVPQALDALERWQRLLGFWVAPSSAQGAPHDRLWNNGCTTACIQPIQHPRRQGPEPVPRRPDEPDAAGGLPHPGGLCRQLGASGQACAAFALLTSAKGH